MYQFNVPDMTCGHCVSSITRALKAEDAQAKVEIDLPHRRVKVQSALPQADLAQCIAEAGYTPTPLA
jgi:copper chaperone